MRLFYLSLLSFVFISTTTLYLTKVEKLPIIEAPNIFQRKVYPPLPKLTEESSSFPVISAQAALAIDLDSGITLYEKNPDENFLPASTTKIVTALVAMDYYPNNLVIKVPPIRVEGQKMGLAWGEEITVNDLLQGLLIYSANDAAEVLAVQYPGGRDEFIKAMNNKAKELNLISTNFTNPTGLDGVNHVSTARDLVRVSAHAMKNPQFAEIVGTKEKLVTSIDGKIPHRLVNINELIGVVEGVLGVKTGWTENARENLVTYIERDGKRIMVSLLGSQDRFGETTELIEWIYGNYQWEEVSFLKSLTYSP